jgi:type IV pilus assembly protein PilF
MRVSKKTYPLIGLICAALLLAACSSTPQKSEDSKRKAAETNTALGQEYMNRGQYEISLEKLKRAVAYDNTYAPAHTMLAVLYETIGQTEDAEKEYRKAVEYDPKNGDVNNNYGAFLCGIGKREEAEKYFLVAINDPFYKTPEVAQSNAGACALARGDLDKAEAFLRQSLQHDDKLGAALLPMAEVSYRKGSYLKARGFLQRYEAVADKTAESLALGVRIETKLGDKEAAQRYRSELSEQDPGSIEGGRNARREQE